MVFAAQYCCPGKFTLRYIIMIKFARVNGHHGNFAESQKIVRICIATKKQEETCFHRFLPAK